MIVTVLGLSGCGGKTENSAPVTQAQLAFEELANTEFSEAIDAYSLQYGVRATLNEFYELVGNAPEARVSERNRDIASALGYQLEVGSEFPKSRYLEQLKDRSRRNLRLLVYDSLQKNKSSLSIDPDDDAGLRWMLTSSIHWQENLMLSPNQFVVGWDKVKVMEDIKSWTLYTFGLTDCTALIVYAKDGSVLMTHDSRLPITPGFEGFLDMFMSLHRNAKFVVIGAYASVMASSLVERYGKIDISIHSKPKSREYNYNVKAERINDEVKISIQRVPMEVDYLNSLYPTYDGANQFGYGRLTSIYGGSERPFEPATFD